MARGRGTSRPIVAAVLYALALTSGCAHLRQWLSPHVTAPLPGRSVPQLGTPQPRMPSRKTTPPEHTPRLTRRDTITGRHPEALLGHGAEVPASTTGTVPGSSRPGTPTVVITQTPMAERPNPPSAAAPAEHGERTSGRAHVRWKDVLDTVVALGLIFMIVWLPDRLDSRKFGR